MHHLFHGHHLEAALDTQPELLADLIIEQEWIEEPRRRGEITAAIDGLVDKVWYSRHMLRHEMIEAGKIKLVDKEIFLGHDHRNRPVQCDIWEGALKDATKVEMVYGVENLGPWDDFKWGVINGKLSALRLVLDDERDMLDT